MAQFRLMGSLHLLAILGHFMPTSTWIFENGTILKKLPWEYRKRYLGNTEHHTNSTESIGMITEITTEMH